MYIFDIMNSLATSPSRLNSALHPPQLLTMHSASGSAAHLALAQRSPQLCILMVLVGQVSKSPDRENVYHR